MKVEGSALILQVNNTSPSVTSVHRVPVIVLDTRVGWRERKTIWSFRRQLCLQWLEMGLDLELTGQRREERIPVRS